MTAADKASLNKIHYKFYGNGTKAKKENAKITKAIKGRKETDRETALRVCPELKPITESEIMDQAKKKFAEVRDTRPTRAELMRCAQAEEIKYFRILSKDELTTVLCLKTDNNQAEIDKIVAAAKARWQAGMTKNEAKTMGGTNNREERTNAAA